MKQPKTRKATGAHGENDQLLKSELDVQSSNTRQARVDKPKSNENQNVVDKSGDSAKVIVYLERMKQDRPE
jgi:hypothetical protein